METHTYNFEFRERYLQGQVNEEERTAYEEAMAHNPLLVQELKQHIYLTNLIGVEVELAASPVKEAVKIPWRPYLLPVAAAIALLIVFSLLWPSRESNTDMISPQDLFAEMYQAKENHLEIDRSKESPLLDSLKAAAFAAYDRAFRGQTQGYGPAIDLFDQVLAQGMDEDVLFFKGMALMEENEYTAAVAHLEKYKNQYYEYTEEVDWYLVLGYLQLGKLSESKTLANKLANGTGPYRDRSTLLLQKLNTISNNEHHE